MATTIKLKNSVTTTNTPTSLAQGEVAINITDKKVWVGNAATTPIQLLGAGASGTFGALTCTSLTNSGLTSGRVTYASTGGLLADSANFTFNGTTVTMANDASISGLTVGKGGGAGSFNTALGYQAFNSGSNSNNGQVAIGYQAMYANTTGYGVAVGYLSLTANTSGNNNVAVGHESLRSNTTASNNTAVGYQAGYSNTTGTGAVFIGRQAGYSITTANYNTFIGDQSGYSNTSGNDSVALGTASLYSNTTGAYITAIGRSCLYANTTGNYNTGLGRTALAANTTGSSNTALGQDALQANTTASGNTAVGYQAVYSNTTGYNNIGIGDRALRAVTTNSDNVAVGAIALYTNTGEKNVAIGSSALFNNTTASYNTAVGYQAMNSNTTGFECVAIGYKALYSHTTGDSSIAIGSAALQDLTTGRNNTAVGYQAGFYSTALTTGAQNILIGAYTRTSAATSTYQFVIGYDVVGQADNNITIGTVSGKIYNAFTVNATWTQTSDGRLKKNIQEETLGLSFINRLRPVKYEWKASNELDKDNPYYSEENKRTTGVVMHGLIAQEVKEALDAEGVSTFAGWDEGEDGIQAISREMFITPLIKAIQELKAEVDSLKAQLNK